MFKITHKQSKLSKLVDWEDFSLHDLNNIYSFYTMNDNFELEVL